MSEESKRRTWHYILKPYQFEIECPKCKGHNIEWSEYEKHIWCYDCNEDLIPEHHGVLDGPIPVHCAYLLGLNFDRFNMITNKIEIFNVENGKFEEKLDDTIKLNKQQVEKDIIEIHKEAKQSCDKHWEKVVKKSMYSFILLSLLSAGIFILYLLVMPKNSIFNIMEHTLTRLIYIVLFMVIELIILRISIKRASNKVLTNDDYNEIL